MPVLQRRCDVGRGSALLVLLVAWFCVAGGGAVDAQDARLLWEAIRTGNAVALIRHTEAPGIGDPANFSLDDCATQRNLSYLGRQQAAGIGDNFRRNGITRAEVFSSAWCRCRDTAELLALGPVKTLPSLNSFFTEPDRREPQTEALRAWLGEPAARAPLVLVSHQVNITALTGVYPATGEIIVVRPEADGSINVLGRL
jgi:phosphohistidine phosphatase SixA